MQMIQPPVWTRLLLGLLLMLGVTSQVPVMAAKEINTDPPHNGNITLTTVAGGALSLLIWPGIGQAINNAKGEKVLTHALIGLLPPFRVWSCYDALVDRKGGYWDGKI